MNKQQAKALANLRRADRAMVEARVQVTGHAMVQLIADMMANHTNSAISVTDQERLLCTRAKERYEAARQGVARREWEFREAFREKRTRRDVFIG